MEIRADFRQSPAWAATKRYLEMLRRASLQSLQQVEQPIDRVRYIQGKLNVLNELLADEIVDTVLDHERKLREEKEEQP